MMVTSNVIDHKLEYRSSVSWLYSSRIEMLTFWGNNIAVEHIWSFPQHLCCKIKNVFCTWMKCWTYEQSIKHEIACSMWSDISELGWKQSCDIWKRPLKYHGFQMSSHLCCKLINLLSKLKVLSKKLTTKSTKW